MIIRRELRALVGVAVSGLVVLACIFGVQTYRTHNTYLPWKAAQTTHAQCASDVQNLTLVEVVSSGDAYFGRGEEYNLACAKVAYLHAIHLDPKGSPTVWHQLGRIDFLEGNFNDALYKFHKQVELFGDTVPNTHYMVGLTYGYRARKTDNPNDWREASLAFQKYIDLDPRSPWARTDMAWILFAQGKYSEMKPYVEVGLLDHPDHPWLLNMYGLALMNTGDKADARNQFAHALRGVEQMSPEMWGAAYPGNDPASWRKGLDSMKGAIQKNLALASE